MKTIIILSAVIALVVACDPQVSVSSNSSGSGGTGDVSMSAPSSSANASGMGGKSSTENNGVAGQALAPLASASASN